MGIHHPSARLSTPKGQPFDISSHRIWHVPIITQAQCRQGKETAKYTTAGTELNSVPKEQLKMAPMMADPQKMAPVNIEPKICSQSPPQKSKGPKCDSIPNAGHWREAGRRRQTPNLSLDQLSIHLPQLSQRDFGAAQDGRHQTGGHHFLRKSDEKHHPKAQHQKASYWGRHDGLFHN